MIRTPRRGLFEVAWAIGLECSDGLTKPVLTAGTVENLPVGTAHGVWAGIGAVGTATLGVVLFDEPADPARVTFISVIVVGIVGLHLSSAGD